MLAGGIRLTRTVFEAYAVAWSLNSTSAFTVSALRTQRTAAGLRMSSSQSACSFQVVQIPCLSDNYGYLLHNDVTGETAAIDTPDVKPYNDILVKRGWKLTHILNTHHHFDHTGGNLDLKTESVKVYGPASEKIPGRDVGLKGGDEIEFGSSVAKVIDVGGHTKGHIAYYFPSEAKVFVGDSLFALGCGRMFEGTPEQNWESLKRLRDLPDDTEVYCAHEYTASNAKFAASVEPGNTELMARVSEINKIRQLGLPTVPSMMGVEKRTNPFLRCDISDEIRTNVGASPDDSDSVVFGKVRRAKDTF